MYVILHQINIIKYIIPYQMTPFKKKKIRVRGRSTEKRRWRRGEERREQCKEESDDRKESRKSRVEERKG